MADETQKPGPTTRQQLRDDLRASSRFSDALRLAAMALSDLQALRAPGLTPDERKEQWRQAHDATILWLFMEGVIK